MTTTTAHKVAPGEGRSVDLGVVRMRVLAAGQEATGARFTLTEFAGTTAGAWTVPHLHRGMEESFYVLEGEFTFTLDGRLTDAGPDSYLLVPRGTPHAIDAAEGGGRMLVLMVPGGLEEMFFELGGLPPDSIRDPQVRAAIAARYDSVPV